MIEILKNWYERHFSNPQVVILALLLISGFTVIIAFGDILMPLLAAVVIAYMLEAPVLKIQSHGLNRKLASILVFCLFFAVMSISMLGLVPLLFEQVYQFIAELPKMVTRIQQELLQFPEQYPTCEHQYHQDR